MNEYQFLRFLDVLNELTCFLIHQSYSVYFDDFDLKKRCQSYLYRSAGALFQARDPLWCKYQDSEKHCEVMNAILAAAKEVRNDVEC